MSNSCIDSKEDTGALLTPTDVAKKLATTPQTVLRWEKSGRIPARVKAGRIVRFVMADVLAALDPRKGGAA